MNDGRIAHRSLAFAGRTLKLGFSRGWDYGAPLSLSHTIVILMPSRKRSAWVHGAVRLLTRRGLVCFNASEGSSSGRVTLTKGNVSSAVSPNTYVCSVWGCLQARYGVLPGLDPRFHQLELSNVHVQENTINRTLSTAERSCNPYVHGRCL